MSAPTVPDVLAYLGLKNTAQYDQVESAFNAEKAAQAQRCVVPLDAVDWPPDLVEALFRRVARNLYMRGLPSGLATVTTEYGGSFARPGQDAEVSRLEAPYRVIAIG